MVHVNDLIGIFDIKIQDNAATGKFLTEANRLFHIETVEVGELKSFIVTTEKLYYSPISSLTLKKRALALDMPGKLDFEANL